MLNKLSAKDLLLIILLLKKITFSIHNYKQNIDLLGKLQKMHEVKKKTVEQFDDKVQIIINFTFRCMKTYFQKIISLCLKTTEITK